MIKHNFEQNSEEWYQARMGRIGASEVYKLLGKSRSKDKFFSKVGDDLIYQKAGEILTGVLPNDLQGVYALEFGKRYEATSLASFEIQTDLSIENVGYIIGEDKDNGLGDCNDYLGCSPDGLCKGQLTGLELKNPLNTSNHLKFIVEGIIKPEYIAQCQYSMLITGYDSWYFATHDFRLQDRPINYVKLERDEPYIDNLKERVTLAVEAIKIIVNKVKVSDEA